MQFFRYKGKVVLKLLPLLLLYILVVFIFSSNSFQGDETDYVASAHRLAQGHYSTQENIQLWHGPGYPFVLLPFVLLNSSWFMAKILNAIFLFSAVFYFYQTLRLYLQQDYALVFSYILGLYPPFLREVYFLLTESLVFFLVCGFMFHFCKVQKEDKNFQPQLVLAAIYLGYLALTKIFFGYVIVIGLLIFVGLYLWRRLVKLKKTALIYLFALIICLPYLLYTYSLTGRVFYWGTSGGMSLYWMSTPYKDEWGSWFSAVSVQEYPELAQHRQFFNRIASLSKIEQDDAFKEQAIHNIVRYPAKYFINWLANIGRLLFSYPFSYGQHSLSTYFYILPNMFIVVMLIQSVYPAFMRWKSIPYEIYILLLFSFITFGGTSLLSAYDRQFRPLIPIILLWISFVYVCILEIKIRSETELMPS